MGTQDAHRIVKRVRYICYGKTRKQTECDGQTGYTAHILDSIIDKVVRQIFERMKAIPKSEIVNIRYREKMEERKALLKSAKSDYAKTDVKDAEWIADLLRHGLLKASYIPNREQRELREITRYRKSLTEERCREVNRLQKILEGANIKLDSVVKDITGKSARKLLQRIIDDDIPDSDEVSKLVHGRMRPKLEQIVASIEGITTPLQRKLLAQIIDHIDDLNRRIGELDKLVQEYMAEYEAAIEAIDEIPGIARRSAEVILAEIGLDMGRFPSAAHLCSWAGVCPGNYQSAGRRKHGKTTKGNKALKTILTQCAKSAKTVKSSYFFAQYQRISARRGKNRATLAVAHSMLIAIYHILKNKTAFHGLGSDYYDSFNRDRKINSYLKRLKALGWEPDAISNSA